MKKRYLVIITILIFIVSIAIRYYPVSYKGDSFNFSYLNLVTARNLSLTGEYSVVNDKDVVLSSVNIEKEGVVAEKGNRLTSILYSKIFNVFGSGRSIPLYVSLLLYGLTTVLLFLLVLKLFNLEIALIFAGLDILSPFVLAGSLWLGAYEWAILFFTIGLLFYLYQKKSSWWNLGLASLFFGLAVLSRNAFLVSFVPFVFYEWWKNKSPKKIVALLLPIILILGGTMLFDSLHGTVNGYLAKGDSGYDGHLFPDAYTYHFDKEAYLQSIDGTSDTLLTEYLIKYEHKVSLKNKIIMYIDSAKYYVVDLFRLTNLGGALILFLIGIGATLLWQKKKNLMILFGFWFVFWYLTLIYLKTNNWDHFLEIRFPLILLGSLGVYGLIGLIWKLDLKKNLRYFIIFCFLLSLTLHFVQADKWRMSEVYKNSQTETFLSFSQETQRANLTLKDVIAIGELGGSPDIALNYYTNMNVVHFNPNTIEKLLKEEKLQWAFDQFGVTRIIGYSPELTKRIIQATDVETLSSNF